jgi:ABC-type transport system involved in multi-copper enzyme maturation permease subunit
MVRQLWRKEMRLLAPFMALGVFLGLTGLVFEAATAPPHLRPLATTLNDYVGLGTEHSTVVVLFTLALTAGLLVREHDEGTMEFLDSLPVSRSEVFLVKVLAAGATLLIFTVSDMAVAALLHFLSRSSVEPDMHAAILLAALALRCCQMFVFLSFGLALSFLRRFGWLVAALLFWGYTLVYEWSPAAALFDLYALPRPQFEGSQWLIPWRQLAVQMTLGAALLLTAYLLFVGLGDWLLKSLGKLKDSRLGAAALFAGAALLVVVGGMLVQRMFLQAEAAGDLEEVTVEYPSWSTSRFRTKRHEFVYPTNMADRARAVMDGAEAADDTVREFLGAARAPSIFVDMSGVLPRHAGRAQWDKILMNLVSAEDAPTLLATFGHESAHVHLERLSDGRLGRDMNTWRLFHEGVASYVEYERFQPEQSVDTLRFMAAVARARRQADFRELVNNELLCSRFDTNLVYPLGEAFVCAMVRRLGEPSVGRVAAALARDDAPRELSGIDAWQDTFQACGYNLDEVVDEFIQLLDEEVARFQPQIDNLPRPRAVVEFNDYFVVVSAHWEPQDEWHVICRFRPTAFAPDRLYFPADFEDEDGFNVARSNVPGATLWYQLGLSDGQGREIYEPWQEAPIR